MIGRLPSFHQAMEKRYDVTDRHMTSFLVVLFYKRNRLRANSLCLPQVMQTRSAIFYFLIAGLNFRIILKITKTFGFVI